MADGRMLKKKISLDAAWADLASDTHRMLYETGIAHLDIEGRISGDPREFKAAVAPMLDHLTIKKILAFFEDAQRVGLINRYEVNGRWFIEYPGFKKNQRLNPEREAPSRIPSPTGEVQDKKCFGQYGWYGEGWPKIKEEIRQRDKVCRRCKKTPEENKRALEVHHLKAFKDFNGDFREANKLSNLVGLCQSCHLEIRNLDEDVVRLQCGVTEDSLSNHRELTLKLSEVKVSKEKLKDISSTDSPPDGGPALLSPISISIIWNKTAPAYLPRVKASLNPKRVKKLKPHVNESSAEYWETLFSEIDLSDFYSGKDGKWTGMDFDWAVINHEKLRRKLDGLKTQRPSPQENEPWYAKS